MSGNSFKSIIDFFKNWHFDLRSSVITILAIPILLIIKKVVLKHVKEWTEYAFEGLMYFISKHIRQSLAATLSMKRYCRLQLANERIRYLNIPSSRAINLDIDKIFVNLTISYLEKRESNFNHKDFLTIGNRIMVMGDPGAGKSSLIKRVFRDACIGGIKKAKKSKLPILVELKNLDANTVKDDVGKWFFEYIKKEISQNKVYKIEDCFENYCSTKGAIFLLDGLDEVSSANYKVICQCINGLSNFLNVIGENNVIILTMRTQFYQQIKNDFIFNFPHATFLKPFTPSDIYEFLSRWHYEKESEKNISRIYKDLTSKPTLREMCSNPLILSMYVAEDQISGGSISPESRTQFYKKVTEELIVKRRLVQISSSTNSYLALKEQRESILGKIAMRHLFNVNEPKNTLLWSNAITIIKEVLNCDDVNAEIVFNEISKETGLITQERLKESFRFIHLTFCEFLAAFEAVQGVKDGWNKLIMKHRKLLLTNVDGKSRLIEVIPFSTGLLPRVSKEKALTDVESLRDLSLMAKCFLETKFYSHQCWNSFIQLSKANLLDNVLNFDEKWLQDLHVFNIVVRDANLASKNLNVNYGVDLSSFYETLIERDKNNLYKILAAFANQDAAAVFNLCEICNINLLKDFPQIVIDNCDQIPFLGLIKDKILNDEKVARSWAFLIVESGLQKKLVANLLNDMEAEYFLRQIILRECKKNVWYYKSIIRETFYTQCVTIAKLERRNNISNSYILDTLFSVESLKQNSFRMSIYKFTSLFSLFICAISWLGFMGKYNYLIENVTLLTKFKMFVLFVVTYITSIFLMSRFSGLRRFYKRALNLSPPETTLSQNHKLSEKSKIGLIKHFQMPLLIMRRGSLPKKYRETLQKIENLRAE